MDPKLQELLIERQALIARAAKVQESMPAEPSILEKLQDSDKAKQVGRVVGGLAAGATGVVAFGVLASPAGAEAPLAVPSHMEAPAAPSKREVPTVPTKRPKAEVHVARAGENQSIIAIKHDSNAAAVAKLNKKTNPNPNLIREGDRIIVQRDGTRVALPGSTLWKFAQERGITVEALLEDPRNQAFKDGKLFVHDLVAIPRTKAKIPAHTHGPRRPKPAPHSHASSARTTAPARSAQPAATNLSPDTRAEVKAAQSQSASPNTATPSVPESSWLPPKTPETSLPAPIAPESPKFNAARSNNNTVPAVPKLDIDSILSGLLSPKVPDTKTPLLSPEPIIPKNTQVQVPTIPRRSPVTLPERLSPPVNGPVIDGGNIPPPPPITLPSLPKIKFLTPDLHQPVLDIPIDNDEIIIEENLPLPPLEPALPAVPGLPELFVAEPPKPEVAPAPPAPEAPKPKSVVTVDVVKAMVSNPDAEANIEKNWPLMEEAMEKEGITDPRALVYYAANVSVEAPKFVPIREYASGRAYDISVNPRKAKELGNDNIGDGVTYKGGGPLQHTGKNNYRFCGERVGVDLVGNPDLILKPEVAFACDAIYIKNRLHRLEHAITSNNLVEMRKVVNGGTNGLKPFSIAYKKGLKLIENAPPSTTSTGVPTVNINPEAPVVATPEITVPEVLTDLGFVVDPSELVLPSLEIPLPPVPSMDVIIDVDPINPLNPPKTEPAADQPEGQIQQPATAPTSPTDSHTENSSFRFPLDISQEELRENKPRWCLDSSTNCHHNYPAGDLFAEPGTPVVSPTSGIVISAKENTSNNPKNPSIGSRVQIRADDGKIHYLAHMGDGLSVRSNQKVRPGDLIGTVGEDYDAMNTPAHLHFDMLPAGRGSRPACSGASCSGRGFINVQPRLIESFKLLPLVKTTNSSSKAPNVPLAPAAIEVPGIPQQPESLMGGQSPSPVLPFVPAPQPPAQDKPKIEFPSIGEILSSLLS